MKKIFLFITASLLFLISGFSFATGIITNESVTPYPEQHKVQWITPFTMDSMDQISIKEVLDIAFEKHYLEKLDVLSIIYSSGEITVLTSNTQKIEEMKCFFDIIGLGQLQYIVVRNAQGDIVDTYTPMATIIKKNCSQVAEKTKDTYLMYILNTLK